VLDETGSDDALGKQIVGWSPRAGALFARALALCYLGRLEEGRSAAREAARVAEDSRELEVLTWVHYISALLSYTCGGPEPALMQAHRCLEIAEQLDNESSRVTGHLALGLAHVVDGGPAAAREALRRSVALARDRRTQLGNVPLALSALSEAHLVLGERTEALAAAREGIERGRAGGGAFYEASAQLALAAALLATGEGVPRAEIESALARAGELVESISGRALSPRILELRGRLAAALGDATACERLLREALDLYRAIGATGHAARLARELGA